MKKVKAGDTVLLSEEGFPLQRAVVLEVNYEDEILTVRILEADREEGDEDGLTECGFEDVYLLTSLVQ